MENEFKDWSRDKLIETGKQLQIMIDEHRKEINSILDNNAGIGIVRGKNHKTLAIYWGNVFDIESDKLVDRDSGERLLNSSQVNFIKELHKDIMKLEDRHVDIGLEYSERLFGLTNNKKTNNKNLTEKDVEMIFDKKINAFSDMLRASIKNERDELISKYIAYCEIINDTGPTLSNFAESISTNRKKIERHFASSTFLVDLMNEVDKKRNQAKDERKILFFKDMIADTSDKLARLEQKRKKKHVQLIEGKEYNKPNKQSVKKQHLENISNTQNDYSQRLCNICNQNPVYFGNTCKKCSEEFPVLKP